MSPLALDGLVPERLDEEERRISKSAGSTPNATPSDASVSGARADARLLAPDPRLLRRLFFRRFDTLPLYSLTHFVFVLDIPRELSELLAELPELLLAHRDGISVRWQRHVAVVYRPRTTTPRLRILRLRIVRMKNAQLLSDWRSAVLMAEK